MSNDNNKAAVGPEEIIARGMRSIREETLSGAIEICETIAGWGGSAAECVNSLTRFRERLRDVPPPAKEEPR